MKNDIVINTAITAYPFDKRLFPCYSHHIAAIVTGHRIRAVGTNMPGTHAEMSVIRKFSSKPLLPRRQFEKGEGEGYQKI